MKQKRDVKLPEKSLFPDWPDPPSVAEKKRKLELEAKAKSANMQRKRRKQLFD